MTTFDSSCAECVVLTFKEGLLSAVAHDLELRIETFDVEVSEDPPSVRASFDPRSIRVVSAMRNGARAPDALSARDIRDIEHNIEKDVLHPSRHPEITLRSTAVTREPHGYRLRCELRLHGKTREVDVTVRASRDGMRVAEATLHQPDFGIEPYSAMLGTMKIKPDVKVRVTLPPA